MNINELTIGEAKEIVAMLQSKDITRGHSIKLGEQYIIRTVTMRSWSGSWSWSRW